MYKSSLGNEMRCTLLKVHSLHEYNFLVSFAVNKFCPNIYYVGASRRLKED